MSALAQMHAMSGDEISGSDRLLDRGSDKLPIWDCLSALGVKFTPQDGSGIRAGLDALVLSTAIENDSPEIARARELGVKTIHRAELLARHVAQFKTAAITGTSGKSTTTAMVFEILEHAGMSPSLITGGAALSLQKRGLWGNVFRGKSDILVIEADESDGSLVSYRPATAAILNLTKDHKEIDVLAGYFRRFMDNCGRTVVNADDPALAEFSAKAAATYGFEKGGMRARMTGMDGFSSRFEINGVNFELNHPGLHNAANALAACALCAQSGVPLETCASALKSFGGVSRRFESAGRARGVEVIDDFAHNPAKISAALAAAQLRGRRVLSFYQPHGFAPVRLLKRELIEAFAAGVRKGDIVWFPDIYYVGGTADKSVSSKELADALSARGTDARYNPDKNRIAAEIAAAAADGDVVMVMGARDPDLSAYAKTVLETVASSNSANS